MGMSRSLLKFAEPAPLGYGRYATTEACSRSGLTVCLAV